MEIKVNPGDLRTKITLQSAIVSKDAGGAQKTAWSDIASIPVVWSQWVYDHGQELIINGADTSSARATVTIRYRSDFDASWRIVNGSVAWKVISPPENVQNKNRWTIFRVERVKSTVLP